jgi:hypothetical protein
MYSTLLFPVFALFASTLLSAVTAEIPNDTLSSQIVPCLSPEKSWPVPPSKVAYLVRDGHTWSFNDMYFSAQEQGKTLVLKASTETKATQNTGTVEHPRVVPARDANHVFEIKWSDFSITRYWLRMAKDQRYTSQCITSIAPGLAVYDVGIYSDGDMN